MEKKGEKKPIIEGISKAKNSVTKPVPNIDKTSVLKPPPATPKKD
jgi:hypothetical protein